MNLKFRDVRADEIECRIARETDKGCQLLLYKDARVDQNILDETVGPFNWERYHEVIDGSLYCTVLIYDNDKENWVSKQDVGSESNVEKEKGKASDAFKRACFNWGIGRELYTAPFIWIKKGDYSGKYDRFEVVSLNVTDGKITGLEIANQSGNIIYTLRPRGQKTRNIAKKTTNLNNELNEEEEALKREIFQIVTDKNADDLLKNICEYYKVDSIHQMTKSQLEKTKERLSK